MHKIIPEKTWVFGKADKNHCRQEGEQPAPRLPSIHGTWRVTLTAILPPMKWFLCNRDPGTVMQLCTYLKDPEVCWP